ncbi:MAG: TonB-dependent receptor [Halieaceae bacterium]|nr:TonB-dependent receptor [Halieaceae bacterium]
MEVVEVIAVTPFSNIELGKRKSLSIQTFNKQDIEEIGGSSIAGFLERRAGSVSINSAQNNPLQPDVRLRGFTASPLLGISQGIVVYQNGIRVNETFGDTVNWDLLPISTVENVDLVAGSSPLLGLNALGGAIAITTKTGFSAREATADLQYGSFNARKINITKGGNSDDRWGYFLAFDGMEESGWRNFSPSQALNLYGALSWRSKHSNFDLYVNRGNTNLHGNGASPEALLEQSRKQVFTHPDITENEMNTSSLKVSHGFSEITQLNLSAFYRNTNTQSFNGDGSEFDDCEPPLSEFLCHETGDLINDHLGNPVSDNFDAINNQSQRTQKSWGGTLQLQHKQSWLGAEHNFIVGADYLIGKTEFISTVEFAELTANRSTTKSGLFDSEGFTNLDTANRLAALYFTDTILLTPKLGINLSTRFNSAHIKTKDQSGQRPELDGNHSYQRQNSGLGITYQLHDAATFSLGIHQASRAPTPVELACSHPHAPCNLPNTFLADPPLNDVVSLNYEIGVGGQLKHLYHWHIGIFRTAIQNDILFQSSGGVLSNQGFFTNAADTQRLGLEINLAGTFDHWSWFTNYSYLRATFEDDFISSSPNHPLAKNGVTPVTAGNRIPTIPDHNLKLGASYNFSERFDGNFDILINSGQFLRGDEANLEAKTDSYMLANMTFNYRLSDHLRFTLQIRNLFDKDYETFGLFGEASEVLGDLDDDDTRFLSPATPRTIFLKLRFGW